ncbi:MAG TPA: hypothetical protein VK472_05715 [Allosphingosinicella sp.]|nr:hypothetical protein [Allosphingosinicella sp.]
MSASNAISSSRKAPRAARKRKEDSSSSTAERFTLTGPSLVLDPRIHAYRRDIADIALAGVLFAPHYARPVTRLCGSTASAIREKPCPLSEVVSTLAPGEEFAMLDLAGGWAWGYRRADHHVGYVPETDLA